MATARTIALGIVMSMALMQAVRADPLGQPAPADAFINLGAGPYPNQDIITTGNAQPWYDSPQIVRLFGGQPTVQQQQSFDEAVLQRVQQTFQLAGIPITLTDNPNVLALHTLSVVSNTSSLPFPGSIGTSGIGANGFSFIDVEAKSAQSLDQLESIVAHNVSHELMLTFGVGENYDKTGNYIDAQTLNWATITSSSATFSPAAGQAILASLPSPAAETTVESRAQLLDQATVPEPTTWLIWGFVITGLVGRIRSRSQLHGMVNG